MGRIAVRALTACVLALPACVDSDPTTPALEVSPAFSAAANGGMSGVARLSGGEEVPSVTTKAAGTAVFRLSADGSELNYRLIVTRIDEVVQAHIHMAPAGVNGPVVAFLFGPEPGGTGLVNGVLAHGRVTESDLIGPLAGATLADLTSAIAAGNTYVNVHTVAHPPGEIRGQIR